VSEIQPQETRKTVITIPVRIALNAMEEYNSDLVISITGKPDSKNNED
jgi:hypothetical protein